MGSSWSRPGSQDRSRSIAVLAATILASSLSFIDGSIINVGLPAIGTGLHGAVAGLQWVINGYLLPLSALVLLGGALGDRLGRGRVFQVGIVLFGVASAACAAAPSLPWLIAGRACQGTGAALLMPNSLAILNDSFEGEARGRAIGIWAAAGAATSGFGPVLGGWLIDATGWRSIFLINLPLAAMALLLAQASQLNARSGSRTSLDPIGVILASLGLGLTTFSLVLGGGPDGWTPTTVAGAACGVVALLAFAAWEHRCGDRAMMPTAMFAGRDFTALSILTLFLYGALGALVVLLPYGLMQAGRAPAALAGAAMLPVTLLLAAFSSFFGSLAGRIGARPLLVVGCATVAGGFLLFTGIGAESDYRTGILPALVAIGIGLAAAVAPLTAAIMASVEPRLAGTASGFNNATARCGALIATACLGPVLGANGPALVQACRGAAVLAAAACLIAAASGLMVQRREPASMTGGRRPT